MWSVEVLKVTKAVVYNLDFLLVDFHILLKLIGSFDKTVMLFNLFFKLLNTVVGELACGYNACEGACEGAHETEKCYGDFLTHFITSQ